MTTLAFSLNQILDLGAITSSQFVLNSFTLINLHSVFIQVTYDVYLLTKLRAGNILSLSALWPLVFILPTQQGNEGLLSSDPPPPWLTLAQRAGALLLADDLLQITDDAVLVSEALSVGGSQRLHLPPVLHAVPLQLDPVLVRLLLQLLEVGVLLQKSQQVGHDCHQGGVCQLGGTGTQIGFIKSKTTKWTRWKWNTNFSCCFQGNLRGSALLSFLFERQECGQGGTSRDVWCVVLIFVAQLIPITAAAWIKTQRDTTFKNPTRSGRLIKRTKITHLNWLDPLNWAQAFFPTLGAWPSLLLLPVSMETGPVSWAEHHIQGSDSDTHKNTQCKHRRAHQFFLMNQFTVKK